MTYRYQRRKSSVVQIGNTPMGGPNPIRIQSMANVSTMDTDASVQQAIRMIEAGAEYVRFTAQGEREAQNLGIIRKSLNNKGYYAPLVADIHFNPKAADVAAVNVEKVRINPGNYIDKAKSFKEIDYTDEAYAAEIQKIRERFIPFLELCQEHQTAIRIGVNHGSLSDRIMSRYGDTPEGMVASCMEFLRICKETGFDNVVISIKSSNTVVMIRTVRLLVQTMHAEGMQYPLHLGVTEAGDDEDGRIKSAVGIGTLLIDGIGDTIRVSLSEAPEAELPVARKLVNYILDIEGYAAIDQSLPDSIYSLTDLQRITRPVSGIGGTHQPVVISDRSRGDLTINPQSCPDYIYMGSNPVSASSGIPLLVDIDHWDNQPNTYPYFFARDAGRILSCPATLKFLELQYKDLNNDLFSLFKQDANLVVVLHNNHVHSVSEARAFVFRLKEAQWDVPVILKRNYQETDKENLQIKAGVDFGALLIDGIGNGIFLCNDGIPPCTTDSYMFTILQAARIRISKTEYISCPGCGRTLYDLQATIARIKAATAHLKGLKIGIMGCIVNGPGEMADADYGYVGAGRGRISLYKGKECILKNIHEEEAVEQLINLIKLHGDWV